MSKLSKRNVKPTQVKIDETKAIKFFDDKFVGLMKKQFDNLEFEAFVMTIKDKEENKVKERLAILHNSLEDSEKNVLTVDADNPETLSKLLEVIEEYLDEK